MSFTRNDYIRTFEFAKKVYETHPSRDTRAEALVIARKCEDVVGQLDNVPAEAWRRP